MEFAEEWHCLVLWYSWKCVTRHLVTWEIFDIIVFARRWSCKFPIMFHPFHLCLFFFEFYFFAFLIKPINKINSFFSSSCRIIGKKRPTDAINYIFVNPIYEQVFFFSYTFIDWDSDARKSKKTITIFIVCDLIQKTLGEQRTFIIIFLSCSTQK